ncbi:MAG: VOC family protein, partial [Actinomycetota bacterium]|nr:VOC family protein [Actinomycetota bacterium]
VQRLGARLGAGFTEGGLHPSFGTRNFILPLVGGCCLEVGAALDHPAVDRAPYGRAVRARAAEGGGWLTWVLRVDDIASLEHRLGRPGAEGHRRRPDGYELRWRQIDVHEIAIDPQLPFFVHRYSPRSEHPSSAWSRVTLRRLEIAGEEQRIDDYLGTSNRQPLEYVEVDWLDPHDEGSGVVAAVFDTASGAVRVD